MAWASSFDELVIELKTCPATDLEPKRFHALSMQRRGEFTQVQCSCGMRGPNYRKRADARKAWNKLTLKGKP